MAEIELQGEIFYYEEHGSGDPLVLIAGYTCDVSHWDVIIKQLAAHFRVLVFDNRGAGRSTTPDTPYSIAMMAEDCCQLVEALGWETFHILGHSMGGAIAQTFAVQYPEKIKKLILSNTFLSIKPVQATVLRFFMDLREQGVDGATLLRGFLPWVFSNAFCRNTAELEKVIQALLDYRYGQSLNGQKRQLEALLAFDSTAWIGKIVAPTLVVSGAQDILTPQSDAEDMHYAIQGSTLYTFPEIGHDPVHERSEHYVALILQFLQG